MKNAKKKTQNQQFCRSAGLKDVEPAILHPRLALLAGCHNLGGTVSSHFGAMLLQFWDVKPRGRKQPEASRASAAPGGNPARTRGRFSQVRELVAGGRSALCEKNGGLGRNGEMLLPISTIHTALSSNDFVFMGKFWSTVRSLEMICSDNPMSI